MAALSLDLGSSFTKAAILDTETGVVEAVLSLAPPPNRAIKPGRHEQDGASYVRQARECLEHVVRLRPDVTLLVLTTQMHGYILTDADNRPISPYVSWQDRAALESDADGRTALDTLQYALPPNALDGHGVPLKPNLALCALHARVREGLSISPGARLHTLGGYVLANLCGEYVCHATNAAPTGLYNTRERRMDTALCANLFGSNLRLPRVMDELAPVGEALVLGRHVHLSPDIGDHQACALGAMSGKREDGVVCVNIGTAGLLSVADDTYTEGSYETRPFFNRLFLSTVSGLPGGRHLDALVHFIQGVLGAFCYDMPQGKVWQVLSVCGCDDGDAPLGLFDADGSLRVPAHADFRQSVAAVYRAMGAEYALALKQVGRKAERIHFTGGAVEKNPALRSAIARRMGARDSKAVSGAIMRGSLVLAQAMERMEGSGQALWY
ncbi:MAG: hypothetical protein LBS11_04410 [Oscillospiraceae bacterium]|jgi:sugar (pentulose or hexulose) kinase|nr:hypothetical protein [Oscillospiraceae bacterium]